MTATLSANAYGKSDVRLTKVIRTGSQHELLEFSMSVLLTGDFSQSYTNGDNSSIVATDSIKNTIYVLAKENTFDSPEAFGVIVSQHFCNTYPQVQSATVTIEQTNWSRIDVDEKPHDHAFVCGGPDRRTASIVSTKSNTTVAGGITDLLVLKTTRSAFQGFVSDRYRTLKDADDRIFATQVSVSWDFNKPVDYAAVSQRLRTIMLETFAGHMSYAVQETIFEIGKAVLASEPAIHRVRLAMPNKHRIPVNLKPFGLDNENEIFVWTDEPFGTITAVVERDN